MSRPGDVPRAHSSLLHSVQMRCEVKGALAFIKTTQHFFNDSSRPQECVIYLPTHGDSVVAGLTITRDDGTVLRAKISDIEESKEAYSDAISAGDTAVLGTTEDAFTFQFSVGNLAPRTGLEVALDFVSPLYCEGNKWLFIAPKWLMPSWENPIPRRFFWWITKKQVRKFDFSLIVTQPVPIISIESLGNNIEVSFDENRQRAEVTIVPSAAPGQINIVFETAEDIKPKTQLEFDETTGEYVGMLSFIPPLLSAGESISDLEGSGDYVLLLDRSISMGGEAIEMAKEATILFIKSLSEGNKFNIVSFGSNFEKMFPESQNVTTEIIKNAVERIRNFQANMGGTNILTPLQAVYSEVFDGEFPRSIFLLTDGGVWNISSVVSLIEANSKQTRVHVFGIGHNIDRFLILEMSKAARGRAEFISDPSEIKKAVMSVLKITVLPSLSNLQVTWPSQTYDQFPSNKLLPVCYFGELLVVFVNYGREPPVPGSVVLQSVDTRRKSTLTWEVAIDTKSSLGNGLHKLWAKHAIRELSIDYKESQSEATLTRVKAISKKYGVPSEFTAFMGVLANKVPSLEKLELSSAPMWVNRTFGKIRKGSIRGGGKKSSSWIRRLFSHSFSSSTKTPVALLAGDSMVSSSITSVDSGPKSPAPTIISLPSASLIDIIILQEVSGKWKCESVMDTCEMPADFQYSDARDMWTTLCVVVVVEAKFAAQAEEWELVVRKARKLLKKAGVSVEQYAEYVRSSIRA